MNSWSVTRKVAVFGSAGSVLLFVLGSAVSALSMVGLLGLGATWTATAVLRARQSDRPVWAVRVVIGAWVVWAAEFITVWVVWGIGYNLTDSGRTVPQALSLTMLLSAVIGLVAFVVMVAVGLYCLLAGRRDVRRADPATSP